MEEILKQMHQQTDSFCLENIPADLVPVVFDQKMEIPHWNLEIWTGRCNSER